MSKLDSLKTMYLMHSNSYGFKNKLKKTRSFIADVLSKHKKQYIAYSTGKDSLCLLFLCLEANPQIDVMFHDSGVELPESYQIIEQIQKDCNLNLYIVKSPENILEIYKNKDAFFKGGYGDIAWTKAMMNPIKLWYQTNGNDLAFIGLRKEESKRRLFHISKSGQYFYCKRNEIHQAYPLANWSGKDVFAFIFSNKLDKYLHPAYYKDRLVDNPEKIRISWFCDPTMMTRGHFLWLKLYYPDVFNMLSNKFPELRSFI
jgi:3'-phosphoadenosine 5'-phosphosulfate sulfotransferase (PAPS reductase)/FAD synthetase